jgi:hypothetical protein
VNEPIRSNAELEARVGIMIDAVTTGKEVNLKVQLLQSQVRLLADRLSMALAIMQGCEIDCGIGGDAEGADDWSTSQRMLLGKDDEALTHARAEMRKFGEYQAALTQVRAWLSRQLAKRQIGKAA